jgi:hypothetical protein
MHDGVPAGGPPVRKDGMVTRTRRKPIRSETHLVRTIADRDARLLMRLRRIRQQIDAGTYLTDEKIDWVVDCLCDALKRGRKRARRATA